MSSLVTFIVFDSVGLRVKVLVGGTKLDWAQTFTRFMHLLRFASLLLVNAKNQLINRIQTNSEIDEKDGRMLPV